MPMVIGSGFSVWGSALWAYVSALRASTGQVVPTRRAQRLKTIEVAYFIAQDSGYTTYLIG